jgi:hypothetical protein
MAGAVIYVRALPSMRCHNHGVIPGAPGSGEPGIHNHERLG